MAARSRPPLAWPIVLAIAALPLITLLACLSRYGWFRDEMYYVACADHLAIGYVDQPPLSIWLLAGWRAIVGEHLAALRLLPALAAPAWVVLTAALARELGGDRAAQALAALAAAVVPTMLGTAHFWSMNAFDMVAWPAALLLFLRATETGSPRAWLGFGMALGLGLLNKISVLWLGAGCGVALLLTHHRRALLTRWPWIAVGIAAAVFAPYLVWEAQHHFATLEFMHNATSIKMVALSPLAFVQQQVMSIGPWTLPLWAAGLAAGLVPRTFPGARTCAIVFLTVVLILMAEGHSRGNYALPAYPGLLACGAVAVERALRGLPLRIARGVLAIELLTGGVIGALLAIPLLPVDGYLRFSRAVGIRPGSEERLRMGVLPQHLADQFGWQELADAVGRAYRSLSPAERAECVIFGQNYGEASAAAVLGRKYGLPRVLSGHNSYWYWGPSDWNGQVMIIIGSNLHDNSEFFEDVRQVGTSTSPYAMPYEQDLPIFIARRCKVNWQETWPKLELLI